MSELLFVINMELKLLDLQMRGLSSNRPIARPDSKSVKFSWTGKTTDLVELIYGLDEMSCINGGRTSIKELSAFFYGLFDMHSKDAYRLYNDIKLRKGDSRTYFLDQMAKCLNERMERDEEELAKRR